MRQSTNWEVSGAAFCERRAETNHIVERCGDYLFIHSAMVRLLRSRSIIRGTWCWESMFICDAAVSVQQKGMFTDEYISFSFSVLFTMFLMEAWRYEWEEMRSLVGTEEVKFYNLESIQYSTAVAIALPDFVIGQWKQCRMIEHSFMHNEAHICPSREDMGK